MTHQLVFIVDITRNQIAQLPKGIGRDIKPRLVAHTETPKPSVMALVPKTNQYSIENLRRTEEWSFGHITGTT